jgi:hypothetical protein
MRLPFEVAPGLSTGVLLRGWAKAGPLHLCGFSLGRNFTVLDAAIRLSLPVYRLQRARLGR